ncbi:hypothetical protein AVEN_245370-1 [Araneus ventricosus]|uniref:Uncharacterized protein n=1 Tax=Araneus ventricosus TaxID=182803 RepID=A0A4Y2VLU2_ARAVE|nr:hypothetical protein AVEN_245370-1 [Araneus ventricosus]
MLTCKKSQMQISCLEGNTPPIFSNSGRLAETGINFLYIASTEQTEYNEITLLPQRRNQHSIKKILTPTTIFRRRNCTLFETTSSHKPYKDAFAVTSIYSPDTW